MTFVNEAISSKEDKERFNSFGFISAYTRKLIELKMWTIDRERDIFLCVLAGAGFKEINQARFLALVVEGMVIDIEAYIETIGEFDKGGEISWDIEKIVVPFQLGRNIDKMIDLVKEALIAHGNYYKTEKIKRIDFKNIQTPIIVGRV